MLPKLFGDERHEGVEHREQFFEEGQRAFVGRAVDGLSVGRFHEFEIPAGELVPEEAVDRHQGFAQAVFAEEVVQLGVCFHQLGFKPAGGCFCRLGLFFVSHFPTLHEAECVPYLVAEVTSLFAECFVEEDVVACRCGEHHAHAHAVSTILFDELERVGRVAERLGHLASQLVAHDAGEVDIAEWHLAFVLVAGHNHAGHPEEDDVRSGHKVGRGVVVADFFVARTVDTVEQRDGPQPGREPRVEAVFILAEVG